MVRRPTQYGGYMFSVLSSLRAAQLVRGSVPRVAVGVHKLITTAQMEVAEEKIAQDRIPSALPLAALLSDAG